MILPRLYAILDAGCFPDSKALLAAAEELVAGGVTLLQYRNKSGNARVMLEQARELKRLAGGRVELIMNDRVDLCVAAEFDGVHLGQDDLSVEAARRILGGNSVTSAAEAAHLDGSVKAALKRCATPNRNASWIGVSTHNAEQLAMADETSADYVAIGPVFATSSKANPDPIVGIDGVRRARELTRKPLVAIGGMTRANAREVIEAGADAVAVISDLIREPRKSGEEFLAILG
jgi:thiamine-phosphate pyrophosphorylase